MVIQSAGAGGRTRTESNGGWVFIGQVIMSLTFARSLSRYLPRVSVPSLFTLSGTDTDVSALSLSLRSSSSDNHKFFPLDHHSCLPVASASSSMLRPSVFCNRYVWSTDSGIAKRIFLGGIKTLDIFFELINKGAHIYSILRTLIECSPPW